MGAQQLPLLTSCPDENALVAFVGREHASDGLESHVATCSECRKLVAEFVRMDGDAGSGRDDADETRNDILDPGTAVDRYVVQALAGQGAMGRVYVAIDPKLDRRVAIKILRRRQGHAIGAEQRTKRFLREARALAKLAHPHVVAIHDVGTDGDRVFIAMEFVDGSTLTDWLASSRSLDAILDVLGQAGRGLAAAHRAGLVHRDFKPDNVLVGSDGRARVTDFGLARGSLGAAQYDVNVHCNDMRTLWPALVSGASTGSGLLLGTPAYMSPEQRIGKWADARADQFAYCVVLYEALFGIRPATIAGETLSIPQKTRHGEHVNTELAMLLKQGLREESTERFPSMDDVLRVLANASKNSDRNNPLRRKKVLPMVAAIGAVSVAAALVAFGISNKSTENVGRLVADVLRPAIDSEVKPLASEAKSASEPSATPIAFPMQAEFVAATSKESGAVKHSVKPTALSIETPGNAASKKPTSSANSGNSSASMPPLSRPKPSPKDLPSRPVTPPNVVAGSDPFGAYE